MPKFSWKKHNFKKRFRHISASILLSLGISSTAFAADPPPINDNATPSSQEVTVTEKKSSELPQKPALIGNDIASNANVSGTFSTIPKQEPLTEGLTQAQKPQIANPSNNLRHEFQNMLNDMQAFMKKIDDDKTHYPVFYSPLKQSVAPPVKSSANIQNAHSAFSPTTELPHNLQETTSNDLEHIESTLTKAQIIFSQKDLIALGFDLGRSGADGIKGRKVNHAVQEFFLFYGSLAGLTENKLDTKMINSIHSFAEQARKDAKTYGISSRTLAAVRLAHLKTGTNFGFLMELAKTESSFNVEAANTRSSARGLYQFTEATWLDSLSRYGAKYGLGFYADHIEFKTNDKGNIKPVINSPFLHSQALDLRFNPRISAMMAGELTQHNKTMLRYIGNTQNPSRTDLYIAHFFGTSDAMTFMRALKYTPKTAASNLFPDLAHANPSIFNGKNYEQIYTYFNSKFNTDKYELPKLNSDENEKVAPKSPPNPSS